MEIIGYLAAFTIGIFLGITGSGGSILTVPTLVYLLGISPVVATSYSLFVVGTTSLVGAFTFYRQGLVCFSSALLFGIPSLLTVFLTRHYLLPAMPENFFSSGDFVLTKEALLMVLFALLMVLASYSMLHENCCQNWKINQGTPARYPVLVVSAIAVGFLLGLVGAGGGFLIIPALVLIVRLDMKAACINLFYYHDAFKQVICFQLYALCFFKFSFKDFRSYKTEFLFLIGYFYWRIALDYRLLTMNEMHL